MSELKNLSRLFCYDTKLEVAVLILGIFFSNGGTANAQIVPDRTLPDNSTVTTHDNIIEIEGGTVRGRNLFHSFREFSINSDNANNAIDTAYFNNANEISTIFSRVTGNSISEINGLIKNNGSADLFLINPRGIIFGENAALDIGGSFIVTTADSLKFADGQAFSAIAPQENSLLTVSIPIGLQYGEQVRDVEVLASGNELTFNANNRTIDRHNRPFGLAVSSGNTLALVGGNIVLKGGNLTAPAGNLALGSVGNNQTVRLALDTGGWTLDYTEANSFGEISLSESASIDVSGNSAGKVWLKGDLVSLTEGSAILTDNLGDGEEGLLEIEANEIEIVGANSNLDFKSFLSASVGENAIGNGSNVSIASNSLSIKDGGRIYLNNYGSGDGGVVTIHAEEIYLDGVDSGLFSVVRENAGGNGANIKLDANKIAIANEAQITLDTLGLGNGGDLDINAEEINLIGNSAILARAMTNIGNGGDIAIATESLSIQDGASLYAGNFDPTADNADPHLLMPLEISPSSISYTIIGTGEVGNIEIDAQAIILDSTDTDISNISTSTYANGGGIIKLNSDTISIDNNSHIFTETKGNSHGGAIYLQADTLNLNQGGRISTNSFALGNAGKIIVDTNNELTIEGNSSGAFRQGERLNFARDRVIRFNKKNRQLGHISVAGFDIDSNPILNMTELPLIKNNQIKLAIFNCTAPKDRVITADEILSPISVDRSLQFWQSPTQKIASKNLNQIHQPESIAGNSVIEATSWAVNSQGKIELLAHSCN